MLKKSLIDQRVKEAAEAVDVKDEEYKALLNKANQIFDEVKKRIPVNLQNQIIETLEQYEDALALMYIFIEKEVYIQGLMDGFELSLVLTNNKQLRKSYINRKGCEA